MKEFGVKKVGLFGSHARGTSRKGSDVDVLVEFNKPPGLFRFLELENYLSSLLGARVDLVTKNALKPRIGKQILHEVVYL
jgi:predicted nucleotidyltransferase